MLYNYNIYFIFYKKKILIIKIYCINRRITNVDIPKGFAKASSSKLKYL